MKNFAVVGVGSNINAQENVARARKIFVQEQGFLKESAFIETEPVGFLDQDNFLNGAFLIETQMSCEKLNQWLKQIEVRLGRVKGPNKFGPRNIDLDIVIWNGEIKDEDIYNRDFLRNSVLELCPELQIPIHA